MRAASTAGRAFGATQPDPTFGTDGMVNRWDVGESPAVLGDYWLNEASGVRHNRGIRPDENMVVRADQRRANRAENAAEPPKRQIIHDQFRSL